MKYIYNILIAIDQLFNTIFGGDPDETISSRLGKNYRDTWMEKFVDWLFRKKTSNHCENAIESDEGKDSILK
jgi:hypothetical protein